MSVPAAAALPVPGAVPVPGYAPPPGYAPQPGVGQPPTRASLRQQQGPPPQPPVPTQPAAPTASQSVPAAQPVQPRPPQQDTGPQAARGPEQARSSMQARSGMGQRAEQDDLRLDEVLARMVEIGASDLHLTSGAPPMVRSSGTLQPLEGFPVLSAEPLRRTLFAILTQKQREQFEAELELDFAYALRGAARFRVNLYQQRESVGAAFRVIPYEIKPLEELGVPPVVGSFAGLPRGLVLVTGPTGSGKSTTLASMVDLANRTRADHIMTVEDPIEFLHRHKKSIINQREVGADTHSFAAALKHVLRQDPDIILVGELRDLETMSVALTAAETGHLVFATLHTQDAAQTIDRIIDVFPSYQQQQVRTQLASALQGVVCQTLCKRSHGTGRVVATEVMVATPAIRNLIREGKTHQIYSAMQAGAQQGMHTLDQHLAELVRAHKITYEVGLEKCHNSEDYNRLTGRTTSINQGASALQGGTPTTQGYGQTGQR
jgi:twitching motility protein PilT